MRIESSVTSVSWIPSEAVEGLPKLPFTFGVAHYDEPPPERIDQIETMHRADLFREANELRGWIDVEDGKIVDHGHAGRGRIGLEPLTPGRKGAGGGGAFPPNPGAPGRPPGGEEGARQALFPVPLGHRLDDAGADDPCRRSFGARGGRRELLPAPLDLQQRRRARAEDRGDRLRQVVSRGT